MILPCNHQSSTIGEGISSTHHTGQLERCTGAIIGVLHANVIEYIIIRERRDFWRAFFKALQFDLPSDHTHVIDSVTIRVASELEMVIGQKHILNRVIR